MCVCWIVCCLIVLRAVPVDEPSEHEAPWLPYLVAVPISGLVAILVYAWGDWSTLAVATLVAGGAFVAGGLLGFLFGIPRSLAGPEGAEDKAAGAYRPNTNLEQISDWLTKILVGVGLVQFTTFAQHAGDLVTFLGPALGGDPLGESFAGATLVVFSISGFLAFYLVTRLYLGRAFATADRRTRDFAAYRRVTVAAATEDLKIATASSPTIAGGLATVDDKKLTATANRAVEVAQTRGGAKVLWVDDRPENNTRERSAMTRLGMEVTTSLSTTDALERLKRSHFDAVISDMGRPSDPQAGYTLLKAMRDTGDTTPFIIYAGSNLPEHAKLAKERGAFGSTNRPDELVDLVLQALDSQPEAPDERAASE